VLIPHGCFPFDVPYDRELTGYHLIEFGSPYGEVVATLQRTAKRLNVPVVGFNDLSIAQVASDCKLSLSQARLAKLREYDEPFRLIAPAPDAHRRLWRALRAMHLVCTHRAVYEHVGAPVDKGTSVSLLTSLYRRALGTVVTVGLGSAANSLALLHRVKMPFVAEGPEASQNPNETGRIPHLTVASSRAAWIDLIVGLARRAREGRRPAPPISAAS
jgi:mannosyl-3-phosphoglycerate phosphatase